MRLVFEEGLFGYKFLALAVMLIILGVVQGRIRGQLVAWLALVCLAFNPIPVGFGINARTWGFHAASALPLIFVAIALLVIIWDAVHHRFRWWLVAWFVLAACMFLQWPLWSPDSLRTPWPLWFRQIVLVPPGVLMAVSPLLGSVRKRVRIEHAG